MIKICNRLSVVNVPSEKLLNVLVIKGLYICDLGTKFSQFLLTTDQKVLSSQKSKLSYLLKIPWPKHLQFNNEL